VALLCFIVLQCLDFFTTLVFLNRGLEEGNPMVTWVLSHADSPWFGLVVTKLLAAFIGQYLYRSGRITLLRRANLGFSLVVSWNLFAIAAVYFRR